MADSTPKVSRLWTPISDLAPGWQQSLVIPEIAALVNAWKIQSEELKGRESYRQFLIKLRRKWAIETEVLERLYVLTDGDTKTLIEKGLDAALITHEDPDRSPIETINLIVDQERAIEGLYQFISGQRHLGTSYIKELHAILTAHQPTYVAIDTLGQRVIRELPRGEWKKLSNNVEGPDGFIFEFCPPEQVDSEMDKLLELHARHDSGGVPPDLQAAWLHHAFTLIHPFTDGNGRVARCLATLILLKHNWFPLVVTRNERAEYMSALRTADAGNLRPLVQLFGSLQSRAVREALSLSEETIQEASAVKGILAAVRSKYGRLREQIATQKQHVITTGDTLQLLVARRLHDAAIEISDAIRDQGENFYAYAPDAKRGDSKAGYNYWQIIRCAKAQDYYANREIYQAWAGLVISAEFRTEILFAFHGIGRESTGVLVCSAMAYTRQTTDTEATLIGEIKPLSEEPFYFTYEENPTDVSTRFGKWIETMLVAGLDYWRKAIGA